MDVYQTLTLFLWAVGSGMMSGFLIGTLLYFRK